MIYHLIGRDLSKFVRFARTKTCLMMSARGRMHEPACGDCKPIHMIPDDPNWTHSKKFVSHHPWGGNADSLHCKGIRRLASYAYPCGGRVGKYFGRGVGFGGGV